MIGQYYDNFEHLPSQSPPLSKHIHCCLVSISPNNFLCHLIHIIWLHTYKMHSIYMYSLGDMYYWCMWYVCLYKCIINFVFFLHTTKWPILVSTEALYSIFLTKQKVSWRQTIFYFPLPYRWIFRSVGFSWMFLKQTVRWLLSLMTKNMKVMCFQRWINQEHCYIIKFPNYFPYLCLASSSFWNSSHDYKIMQLCLPILLHIATFISRKQQVIYIWPKFISSTIFLEHCYG